ncbi:MAG: hypothetical protein E5V80_05205 [Mesorhizobium sp.]|nr:MAG: hypothetical protein E5V80_05205 [Mesorhizobium sp.]
MRDDLHDDIVQPAILFPQRRARRQHGVAELAEANDRLALLASTDPLTGVANQLQWSATQMDERSVGHSSPVACQLFLGRRDRIG